MKLSISIRLFLNIILLCALFGTSCSDDNFLYEEEEIEVISSPDTAAYTIVTGLVQDRDQNAISSVIVEYEQDGMIESTTTDAEGQYTIPRFDASEPKTKIRFHNSEYAAKIDIVTLDNAVVTNNVVLVGKDEATTQSSTSSNPNILDSLVAISGQMVDNTGQPASNIIILVVDLQLLELVYAVTDDNGFWSVAAPPEYENVAIFTTASCQPLQLIVEDLSIDGDTDTGTQTTNTVAIQEITISGFVTDCNTEEGLLSGEIIFSFPNSTGGSTTAAIVDGMYEISVPLCVEGSCIDATIVAYALQSGTTIFECNELQEGANVFDFSICNPPIPTENEGFITAIMGQDTVVYPLAGVTREQGKYYFEALDYVNNTGIIFSTIDESISGNLSFAAIIDLATPQSPIFFTSDGTIVYELTTVDEDQGITGTYAGTITNQSTGEEVPLSGSFFALWQ